jgi:hypothetical protein
MNKVEDRLRTAAEETRQLARRRPVTRFVERPETRHNGMLILASAFAVVIVIFGLIPAWLSDPRPPGGTNSASSTPVQTVTTIVTTTNAPESSCSSANTPLPAAAEGLPSAVANTRDAVIAAAAACDLDALVSLAGEPFATSYGGGGAENLRSWEEQGKGELGTMLRLLDMTYGTTETDQGAIYVWPAAATYDTWEDIPDEQLAELGTLYSHEELEQISEYGSYIGWRTGIDQDGNWMYFIAGD